MTRSIRLKLVLAFNIFLVALAIIGYFTYRQLDRSRDLSTDIHSGLIARVEHAGHLGWQMHRLRSLELAYVLSDDPAVRDGFGQQMVLVLEDIDLQITAYRESLGGEPPSEYLPQTERGYRDYVLRHQDLIALTDEGRTVEAMALYGASNEEFQEVEEAAHALFHVSHGEAQTAAQTASSLLRRLQYLMAGSLVAAAVLIVAVGHPLSTGIHRRLQALLEGIARVTRGELDQPVAARGSDEIAEVGRAFNAMIGSLRAARDEVSELHRRALSMQEERIALLESRVAQVVQAQEEERRRVARELHDQAGQVLTALQLGLSRLQLQAPSPEVERQAASLREMALEAMTEVRNLALDLRPSALDELGLAGALKEYVHTFSSRTAITARLAVSGTPRRLPAEAEITLFRIAQEGLTNAAKHSAATQVSVSLEFHKTWVQLAVEDDGVGFDVDTALGPERYKSLGLLGIQERCHLIGAAAEITARPGAGTRLAVALPTEAETPPAAQTAPSELPAA